MKEPYSKKIGSYLIAYVLCMSRKAIVEVVSEEPFRVKVGETDDFNNLLPKEFDILEEETIQFQSDLMRNELLRRHKEQGDAIACGLKSLGVHDECFYEMLPPDIE